MRILAVIISIVLVFVNILAGIILKDYQTINVVMTSCVLIMNSFLLWFVGNSDMKDAFKVSLYTLFPLFCIIEFILALLTPKNWENNYYIVGMICCMAIQIILLFAAIKTTQHNNKK